MATQNTLRYLKVDYQAHKDALLQRIRDRWPRNWNDFLANSFGIVLVDIVAWAMATLAFLLNRIGAENFISTMTLRESAVRLGSLVGYVLHSPLPATVSCEAVLTSAQAADTVIPQGTLIRTSDGAGLPFEVAQNYTIYAGSLTPRNLVVTFSPLVSGANVINSFVSVTSGSVDVDLVDSSIDLSQFISSGQSFNLTGDTINIYTIQSLENAPGAASSFTRMVLDRPFAGTTGMVAAQVYEQRIQLIQGQTITDRFVAPSITTPSYAVKLSRTPVIDNSVQVTVNGELWAQVKPTDFRSAIDTVYQVKTYVSGDSAVVFGDGTFGAVIPVEAAIVVTYRVGGGVAGNIGLNTINTTITGLVTTLSNPVPVAITNAASTGIGGQDAETLEQARTNIPFYTRTNDRAVTLNDYQTLASQYNDPQFGSVAFARASVRSENSFLEGNIVVIYAWTTSTGGGLVNLTSQLKQALQDYLQTKAVGTDLVEIFDGVNQPVPVALRYEVAAGSTISDVQQNVISAITAFINSLVPGQTLLFSDLMQTLEGVYGLSTFNIATPLSDLIAPNSTTLFTPPQDTFVYDIMRNGSGSPQVDVSGNQVSPYTAQLPIFPLQAWAFSLFLGANQLTVVPYVASGQARVFGANITTDDNFPSVVNLLTGQVTLWLIGAPGDLMMQLITAQGYSALRVVNVYIGYVGDNTATERQQIRAALRAWSSGLAVGGTIYAARAPGILASNVSITDVVTAVTSVDYVTRVALDTPANTANVITAADFELLQLGSIVLNNNTD